MLAALIDGMNEGGGTGGAGAAGVRRRRDGRRPTTATATARTWRPCSAIMELCWGDVGLLLSMPRQGLGNSRDRRRSPTTSSSSASSGKWAAMAITEPEAGSDSAAIRTTAVLDGDEYVLNGEKIYVTSGERADLVVVWATLDREQGRAAIKSFVVERSNPGLKLDRLEHKLGIRASDTAAFSLEDCRVPKEDLLGSPEIDTKKGFAGVMQTFDNTRPLVAAMAVGVARACLEETRDALLARPASRSTTTARRTRQSAAAAELLALEADYEAARLLTLAGRLDGRQPQAQLAPGLDGQGEGGAHRRRHRAALRARCAAASATARRELLEKWARDAKILDLFEGTQQIQLLIIARQLLGQDARPS